MATIGPISQYDILRKLARGGMGEVYLARQTGIEGFAKEVVIKRIHSNFAEDPHFVDMFLQEARIAALLDHPNIVQIYELGKQGDNYFIVMEYVRGLSLSRLLKATQAPLPTPLAIQIAAGVAAGLQFAHERRDTNGAPLNLVHRDISPPNVLLSTSGSVKITDFGIAKVRQSVTQTQAGVIKGKWSYISPEQARGAAASPQSDIYSLGLVLYEMTTGARAYPPGNDKALLRSVANGQIPPPELHVTNYQSDLRAVLMRALEPDKHKRYQECQELQEDLLALLVNRQIVTSPAKLGQFVAIYFEEPGKRSESMPRVEAIPGVDRELMPDEIVAVAPIDVDADMPGDMALDRLSADALDSLAADLAPEVLPHPPEPGPVDEFIADVDTKMDPQPALDEFDDDADTIMYSRAEPEQFENLDAAAEEGESTEEEAEVVIPALGEAYGGADAGLGADMGSGADAGSGADTGSGADVESWDSELAALGAPPPEVEQGSGSLTGASGEVSVVRPFTRPTVLPWLMLAFSVVVAGGVTAWVLLSQPEGDPTEKVAGLGPDSGAPPTVRASDPDAPAVAPDSTPPRPDATAMSPDAAAKRVTPAPKRRVRPRVRRRRKARRHRSKRQGSSSAGAKRQEPGDDDDDDKTDLMVGTVEVAISTQPRCEVYMRGRRLGKTPVTLTLLSSTVTLELRNDELGLRTTRRLKLSGAKVNARYVFGKGVLRFKVPAGSAVTLDGKPLGDGPLRPVAVYEGLHVITITDRKTKKKRTRRVKVRPKQSVVVK